MGINAGRIFRRVSRFGKVWGEGITPKAIWHIVKAAAQRAGIQNLAPHDLSYLCAPLPLDRRRVGKCRFPKSRIVERRHGKTKLTSIRHNGAYGCWAIAFVDNG